MTTNLLPPIAELAATGHHLCLSEEEDGLSFYAAQQTFKGRVLTVLSHIPILRDLQAVIDYCDQLRTENAQALGVFMKVLADRYGDQVAERALMLSEVSYSGHTPLNARVVSQVIKSAESLQAVTDTPKPIGFQNLGNTCFANSALKLLIAAMGQDLLTDRLHELTYATSNAQQKDAALKFLALLDAYAVGNTTAAPELRAFFNSLEQLDAFAGFPIIGFQNDSREFLEKLMDAFELNNVPGYSTARTEIRTRGQESRFGASHTALSHTLYAGELSHLDMQGLVDSMGAARTEKRTWGDEDHTSEVTTTEQWSIPDLSALQRLTLHIETSAMVDKHLVKVAMPNAKFDSNVSIVAHDQKTKQKWILELEPKEIIIQHGSTKRGHYYAYTNNALNQWVRHDDDIVEHCGGLRAGEVPTLISYSLKKAVPWADRVALSARAALPATPMVPKLRA